MKYMHGTDERRKDVLWIWANRVGAIILIVCSSAVVLIVGLATIYYKEVQCGWSMVAMVFCGVSTLLLLYIGVSDFDWRNAQYILSEKGIVIVYTLKTVEIPWKKVKSVSVHPVDIFRPPSARDYIIVQLSDSPLESERFGFRLNLIKCRICRKKFLAIRYTQARMQEFLVYAGTGDG